jgi:hypothetical protein
MKLALSLVLSALSVFFLVFAPSLFMPELEKNIYTVREEQRQEQFEGFLTLWHVSDYPNSGRAQLNRCTSQIEKQNLHVFIDSKNLNTKMALDLMQKGQFPDIISFSSGLFTGPSSLVQVAPNESVLLKLQATCVSEGKQYAYPYMVTAKFPGAEEELTPASQVDIRVQYIGFKPTDDAKKYALYMKLANLLLSESMQKNLIKTNCVPTTNYVGLYETEDNYSVVYEALSNSLMFQNAFGA